MIALRPMTSSARCVEHPDRTAAAPCERCGAFRCDWCVKLAPSWGPGLCAACQKRAPTAGTGRLPRSRLFMLVSIGVLLSPFLTGQELLGLLALPGNGVVVITAAIAVVLLVWNLAAIVLAALRHHTARVALLGYFAVRFVISLLGALGTPEASPAVWWPVPVQALLFLYVGWSADATAFLRPKPAKSASQLLAEPDP